MVKSNHVTRSGQISTLPGWNTIKWQKKQPAVQMRPAEAFNSASKAQNLANLACLLDKTPLKVKNLSFWAISDIAKKILELWSPNLSSKISFETETICSSQIKIAKIEFVKLDSKFVYEKKSVKILLTGLE